MLTFTSTTLESLIGYAPAGTAKFRIVLDAALPGFEVLNFARNNSTGRITLAQP